MLLEFKTKNYKSFADEMIFSMMPAPKQKGLDYSIQTEKIGSKLYKGLSSAVIYGPNASGKTNIIGAMDTMKAIVQRGNIRNSDMFFSPNAASSSLELIPNCNGGTNVPTVFSVKFIEASFLIEYSLEIELGEFMDKDFPRKIIEEKLVINGKEIYVRNDRLSINIPSLIKSYLNKGIKNNTSKLKDIAESSLNPTELFLNNGFKSIYTGRLFEIISEWFENKFVVIYRSDAIRTMRNFADPKEDTIYVEKTLTEAARMFGVTSNTLGYKPTNKEDEVVLCSIFKNKNVAIAAEAFESYGTIRFINEFPLVINVMLNGGTLIMDEFDASIHPMALMNLINIFHNDDININHAQLIFNTHNPIFLNASLFRRDEIKFVERDDMTGISSHYALSDFKTADGVRKGEDYMNNYFVNRYGAIKDIDFSDLLEKIISNKEEC